MFKHVRKVNCICKLVCNHDYSLKCKMVILHCFTLLFIHNPVPEQSHVSEVERDILHKFHDSCRYHLPICGRRALFGPGKHLWKSLGETAWVSVANLAIICARANILPSKQSFASRLQNFSITFACKTKSDRLLRGGVDLPCRGCCKPVFSILCNAYLMRCVSYAFGRLSTFLRYPPVL